MTARTLKYIPHHHVERYEAAGWKRRDNLQACHHGEYSIIMEAPRLIIGLSGRIGCGKSTIAEHLELAHGYHRHRMAGPLKAMMRCLGLDDRHIEGSLKEQPCDVLGGATPRYAMQTIGTEWGRDLIHKDLWANAWAATLPAAGDVVCEDVRFQNEAEAVRAAGGVVIRIERECETGSVHVSEKSLPEPDFAITNDVDIAYLLGKIDGMIAALCDPDRADTFGQLSRTA